jgi:hypothetical protein
MKRISLSILFVTAKITSAVFAQGSNSGTVTIEERRRTQPPCNGSTSSQVFNVVNGTADSVNYNASSCASWIRILVSPSNLNIPRISINLPGTAPADVTFGQLLDQGGSNPASTGNNWRGLSVSGPGRFYGGIGGNLIDTVSCDQIFRFDADGQINAGVVATNAGNFSLFIVEAGSFGPNTNIQCVNGLISRVASISMIRGSITANDNINLVQSTSGGFSSGSITSSNGRINSIALSGDLGSATQQIAVSARNGIGSITASQAFASIVANANGGPGDLGYLAITGTFAGSIAAADIESGSTPRGLDIGGNLDATITCTGQIKAPILVDGTLLTGRTVAAGANGITSQVILNQDGLLGVGWPGSVTISGNALAPNPYYDNAPSALGGGAIGLAPFMVHYEACNPVAAGDPGVGLGPCTAHARVDAGIARVSITHYGPVGLWNGTTILNENPPVGTEGFTVEVASAGSCTWIDVTDSFVTKWIGGNDRTFDIEGPFSNLGPCFTPKYYRIKPVRASSSGRYPLVCRSVDGNPLAGDYEYFVEIEPPNCTPPGGDP